jgi:hypothetical protein
MKMRIVTYENRGKVTTPAKNPREQKAARVYS